ncbi:MAG: hypothetical protein KY476_14675 [Planctomycetes bacterium]|nr:hypothetical protein [Planctomycetota bacterium]
MSPVAGFKRKLRRISRLWEAQEYETALTEVDALLETWPGNPRLHILRACLVQLQEEDSPYELTEAREALEQALQLDEDSAAAAIELGYFLDNVEDDPREALKAYAKGVATARQLLIDGLIGQAKAFLQLEKRDEFLRCLQEILHLAQFERGPRRSKAEQAGADVVFTSPSGPLYAIDLKGRYGKQIQDLLNELAVDSSA